MKFKQRLNILKHSAKKRGYNVDICFEEYKDLLNLGCVYCGETLLDKGGYCLDRIDNSIGYITSNVTPCCKTCNMAKSTMGVDEFLKWIEKVYNYTQKAIKTLEETPVSKRQCQKLENKYQNSKRIRNSKRLKVVV